MAIPRGTESCWCILEVCALSHVFTAGTAPIHDADNSPEPSMMRRHDVIDTNLNALRYSRLPPAVAAVSESLAVARVRWRLPPAVAAVSESLVVAQVRWRPV